MANPLPKTLAFRHTFVSSVVKENTVTLFGEVGSEFELGTDYDAEVLYKVSSSELSNLFNYYNGGLLNSQVVLPNGSVGSADLRSLLSVNAEVTSASIKPYNFGYKDGSTDTLNSNNSKQDGGQYYLGDVVLYTPYPGKVDPSCWTCIRTTSSSASPIPLRGTVNAGQINRDAVPGSTMQYAGFYGPDKNSQNYITGVKPSYYTYPGAASTAITPATHPQATLVVNSEYWKESSIAKSYVDSAIYYAGEVVTFSGGVYECMSTQGDVVTPSLYLNPTPGDELETIKLSASLEALNGAYGVDFGGQRYIQNVPPSGGVHSEIFWKAGSYRRLPTSVYANLNWRNFEVNQKINEYDANITGGNGAQTIPTFTDDAGSKVVTLRKIYDDNEKGFIMDVATTILSRIPAAAIKAQLVGQRPTPDSSLSQMVMAGPHWTYPENYAPAVQGVFEEAVYRDMLQVSGVPTTITDFVVSTGSEGYFQDGLTGRPRVELIETVAKKSVLATNPLNATYSINNRVYARCGISRIFVDKSKPSYAADTNTYATGDVLTFGGANFYQEAMFYISPTAVVNGVDENGKILSVTVTNPGDGILGLPVLSVRGTALTYLTPFAKVTSLASTYDPDDAKVNNWGFANGDSVKVSQGTGSGATGYALVTTIAGSTTTQYASDLKVTFDEAAFPGLGISSGSDYLGPPNNLYKQDLVMLTSSTGGRVPAVVTKVNTNGGILEVELLQQGTGYLQAPMIQLERPPLNPLDTAVASHPSTGSTGGNISSARALGVAVSGRYSLKNSVGDTVLPQGYVTGVGSTFGGIYPYMGVNYVDVLYGGQGFRAGEVLDVVGSITPAVFTVNNTITNQGRFLTAAYGGTTGVSVNIINGGNGYKQGQYVLLDGPTGGVDLLGLITRLGGNATSLSFQGSDLCGVDFEEGQGLTLTGSVHADTSVGDVLIAKITEVGGEGQLYDEAQQTGGATSLAYSNVSGSQKAYVITTGLSGATYAVQDQLIGIPLYSTVQSITISASGAVYSGLNPTIVIDSPTGISQGVVGFTPTDATATPVMGLAGIGVTGAPGKDFASGDFIFIGQVNGVGGAATPARAVVLQTDSAGAILALAVEGSGQNFDVAKVLEYTTSGDGKASDNTTSGAAFDAMFRSFFTIVRVDMTDVGLGYAAKPIVTISTTGGTVSGVPQVCNAVTQRSGSGALFQLTSFNATTTPITFSVKLLDRGIDYVEGDILEFLGPVLSTPGYERSRGVLALVDTVVKGNVLGVELVGPGTKQGTLYKPGAYTFTLPTGNLNNPTTAAYDLRFRVLTVGDPSSISELDIVQSNGDYEVGNQFSHKKLATVTVEEVDSFGKIVSLSYEPGYGYRGFPVVKPKPESSGLAALFNVPYMGVSRIENAYYNNTINVANVVISSPISLLPATAYATIPGDLHPISVDLFKNPNILDTLETIKPGSTTGYAQGKATMSIQNIFVKHPGKSLGNLLSTSGGQNLTINISPPDLSADKGGVQAVAFVQSSGFDSSLQRILAVTVPVDSRGAGYLKPPTITVTLADGNISDDMPILVAQMAVTGVNVTSRGLGFGNPPGAQISDSDVTPGLNATITSTTLKKTLTEFEVTDSGAQYISVPEVNIFSEGTGQLGYVRAAITDIQVVSPGAGFKVGDVLEFGHFGTSGATLTYEGATGIPALFNSPPPSDKVYRKGYHGSLPFQSTECAQACVSEVDSLGGIVSVKVNNNPWSPSKDKYGIDTRVLSKNSIQSGGVGYGYPEYFAAGVTYKMETLPRVIGFHRPDEYGAEGYFSAGTTLATASTVPWVDPTTGALLKGATYSDGSATGVTYLSLLGLDTSGTTLLSDLYAAKTVRLPKIEARLGVRKFDIWEDKEGNDHVNDAQILVEAPPQAQQARYSAVRNATTNTITSYSRQSAGSGYIAVPKVTITGGSGTGANATPKMGLGEVTILDGGADYTIGDLVWFPQPASGKAARGVVTVVDGGVLSLGRQAVFRFAGVDTATPITYNATTGKLEGWGATGTAVLVTKGFGYRSQDIIEAVPQNINSAWIDNYSSFLYQAPIFPKKAGVDEADVEYGRMYTWGNITSSALFNQELGYVFGVRPPAWTRAAGDDVYAILMVNSVITKKERLLALYDSTGALIAPNHPTLGQYSYRIYTALGDRTGLVTATTGLAYFAQMSDYGSAKGIPGVELPFPSFKFMGWSDGNTAGPERKAYSTWWYNIPQGFPEYLKIPRTPAQFRVDNVEDQANGSLSVTVINGGSGSFFDSIYSLEGNQRGAITYINITDPGSGYTSVPDSSSIEIRKLDGTISGSGAKLYTTLSLIELTATTPGNLYFTPPTVYVDPPTFRSLKPQLYSRSAEILVKNGSYFDWESADPAIEIITAGVGYVESGIYKLVVDSTVGGLHQEGNASFSVDTLLMLGGSENLNDTNDLTSGVADTTARYGLKDTVAVNNVGALQGSIYIVRGSNYRPNELYKLVPHGTTPSLSTATVPGVAAVIKIKKVTDKLSNDSTQVFGSGTNDYSGILDEGKKVNGEDVGGYGTGYLTIPKIRIAGGAQGVQMAPSLALTGIDFLYGQRGTNYNVNDEIWAEAPEFGSDPVGKVSAVVSSEGKVGLISKINLYTPYKEGLRSLPKLTVVRKGAIVEGSEDALLQASLGLSKVAITANTDGFVGDGFVQTDFPEGKGYVVQPRQAFVDPKYVFMVDQVEVNPNGNSSSPVLYEKAPVVKFDIPPFINTYSGWNGLYFAPGDAFEIVIQYTIAKAVAFQVDPDVTLPGKYLEADSITIGGVTIPLRKPGAASSQGREISQNRVVYKYLVKFQAQ
jgi:hypothetical protein